MRYLHEHEIIQRDLKPDNVLMDDQLNPKIADFGLSKSLQKPDDAFNDSTQGVIDENNYTKSGDVYAFAITALQIMSCKKPFEKSTNSNLSESSHKLFFELVDELSNKFSVDISGNFNSCFVVLNDGKVFGRGSNRRDFGIKKRKFKA